MRERPFMSDRHAIYFQLPVLVAICCGVTPILSQFAEGEIAGAIVIATICSSTIFAAAWAVIGPGWLIVRWPLSFAWAALVGFSADLALLWERNSFINLFGLFAFMTSTLWLVCQVPFWGGVLLFDLRLHYHASGQPSGVLAGNQPRAQFTIRRLMLFTALVAVSLGLVRLSLEHDDINFIKYFGFLFFSQLSICVPLIYAALMPRWAVVAVSLALLWIALLTAVQPSIAKLQHTDLVDLSNSFFVANLTSICWILLFAALIRYGGYLWREPNGQKLC
jgi:hypothetical protein